MEAVEVSRAPLNQSTPTREGGRRRRFAPAALAVFVTLVSSGCSQVSPVGPVQPVRFQATVVDQTYPTGEAMALALPPASGGNGPLSYTLRPAIPGLAFDADERTLRGTPTEPGSHRMTYTATDGRVRVTHSFTITLEDDSTYRLKLRYRGTGDQVFVLNPDGGRLDDARHALDLGDATAEVYLIATNTAGHDMDPHVERLELGDGAAAGPPQAARDDRAVQPRAAANARVAEREWITEFNNNPPLSGRRGSGMRSVASARSRRGVAEGDREIFRDLDDNRNIVSIPATAREVVTDGHRTAALWVADREWGPNCRGAGPCLTREMVEALADRFLRPGAGNDIYDWVTAIYGDPWGRHPYANVIPPAAAREIHILLFDIERDGVPEPGECRIVGFFWAVHNLRRSPDPPISRVSAERLIFFMDSVFMALPEGATWELTDRAPSVVISALAHEFQHMIHFYQKRILRDAVSEAWLNEMASEVAEDLIADKLRVNGPRGVAYDDPTAGAPGNKAGRLPYYNLFNDVQVTTWDGKIANYAVNYALGAYLARTYGGAELFSEIVQSRNAGVGAIEAALAATGHAVSFGEILADWAVATLLSDNPAAPSPYRYNPGTWSTSYIGGEEFRLGSIDLYRYRYEPPEQVSDCIGPDVANRPAQEGPHLHSLQTFNARPQPPHSNMIAALGRNSGRVRLRVTAAGGNRITVVVKE